MRACIRQVSCESRYERELVQGTGDIFEMVGTSLRDWSEARQECTKMFLVPQHLDSLRPFPQAGCALYEILVPNPVVIFLPTQRAELSTSLSRNENLTR